MEDLGPLFSGLLGPYGLWSLFGLAILETCFVTGLVVPSGTAAAFVAAVGGGDPVDLFPVVLAITAGGWIGDWVGYGIGRAAGPSLLERPGWVGGTLRRHRATAGRFLDRHPFYSVTVARLVSFVRTLMPMSAGMSRIGPFTYFVFELPGVVAWAVLYVGVGYLAGESWQFVTSLVGVGWLVLFGVVGGLLWLRARRRGGEAA
ncbi:MAG TPA: DedA family protein [Longimicrobiales bacterium]|nr:DedA family protein [Longimicrobiales bacterium]